MCLNTIHDHVHVVAQVCHDSSENIQADIVARVAQVREVIYSRTAYQILISKIVMYLRLVQASYSYTTRLSLP